VNEKHDVITSSHSAIFVSHNFARVCVFLLACPKILNS
jgi:hypothetical protein